MMEPLDDVLRGRLLRGLAAAELAEARTELGLSEEDGDLEVARALVENLLQQQVAGLGVDPARMEDPRPATAPELIAAADASFLGKLGTEGAGDGALVVSGLLDPRTVLAVVRAGALRQRRAAVRRLTELLSTSRKRIPGEQLREATEGLLATRDVEIAYELSEAQARLPGSQGRVVQKDREAFHRVALGVADRIQSYWDGEHPSEPFSSLPGDQRALLLMRTRDLPDSVVDHLSALVENADTVDDTELRMDMLTSLRFSGDPRLVAPLLNILRLGDLEFSAEAARALGRIEDPRVHPVLVAEYERSVVDRHRTVLAGALGNAGDARGLEYLRSMLGNDDLDTVRHALEGLASFGSTEDCEQVTRLIDTGNAGLQLEAVRTLGRVGDGRALGPIRSLRSRATVPALAAELEDAEIAIRARLELRGEEPAETGKHPLSPSETVALAHTSSAPAMVRFRSWNDFVVGLIWLAVGAVRRAVARFERAAIRRPGWARPLLSVAMVHARENRHSQALTEFRRALEADRSVVESNPAAMRAFTRSFLLRADEVEKDGREDIARGLLEEATSLDLRRAPSALRFELNRRHEAMRRN